MIDQANTLSSYYNGTLTNVFTKSSGAGETYLQSVGNTLYFADGIDNKKWLQTLNTWQASTELGVGAYPFFSTFIIDNNNNIEQLIGTFVTANSVTIASGILTVGLTTNPIGIILPGDTITFPPTMTATFLENLNLPVTAITSTGLTFNYLNPAELAYSAAESNIILTDINSGAPETGTVQPTWSAVIPTYLNNFAGGVTYDNSVIWVNRGPTVENWGIDISKGYQIPTPSTNSPVNPYTMTGGSSYSAQSGAGSTSTSTTLSGFTSEVVNSAPVTLSCSLSISALAVPVTISGYLLLSGNVATLQYSTDSGTTWTTFYTQSWNSTTDITVPCSVQVTGLTNINTLQVKILTTSFASGTGGSANLTATLGAVTATIGQIVTAWTATTAYTVGQMIVDNNFNIQTVSTSGTSGAAQPLWGKVLGGLTTDGSADWTMTQVGSISAYAGGYRYAVALVNTLDNTVSNCTPLSNTTGNFIGESYVTIPPGAGLPPTSTIDPQADYVAIFRTTDGQSTPFLIPGEGSVTYTLPLTQYLQNGYHDVANDTDLNNLIEGAIVGENTPPAQGAINLSFHLNCIFYSIGNVVSWTSGPATPVGNGLNGTNPLNFDSMPSLVKRLVPISTGMLVFTVSDIYLIQGNNTSASPILPAIPILPGIGILSYNALDINGSLIGLFTTDNQFLILDPTNGTTYAGLPIGNLLLQRDIGTPGQNWNPANVYVAYHVQGMDQGWYLCDGQYGWYKLIPTPSPEGPGYTWAPFATITGGAGAVQSVEIEPGVHRLLIGPTGTGKIQERNLNVFTDNGTAYPAFATIGSAVLTQPGQVATVAHIVTDSVKIGTPVSIGILADECLPYYTGPIDILKNWVPDPPNLPTSKSLYSQRFYLSELPDETATMRHMQIQIIFNPADTVQNEILTLTIFGAFQQEL